MTSQMYSHASISELVLALKRGEMVILVDDEDRENEGDLVVATEHLTEEHLSFMLCEGRGLICVTLDKEFANKLELRPQTYQNNSSFRTPFSFSLDHSSVADRGMSVLSRLTTMKALIDSSAKIQDFVSPGSTFPLVAHEQGVLGRRGQTEGSRDLARLAGLKASGVICEILDEQGKVRRGEDLFLFAEKHNLLIGSVEALVRYRLEHEVLVHKTASDIVQTELGEFRVVVFEEEISRKEHLALVYGDITTSLNDNSGTLCRLHSECLTGDVLGSERCDCGGQLEAATEHIREHGSGVILYLRQEGRGIGLVNKLRAYELQDRGADTVEANLQLGFGVDERDFRVAAEILKSLGVHSVKLMTNNPNKCEVMERSGVKVVERIPSKVEASKHNHHYLHTKATKLGHYL